MEVKFLKTSSKYVKDKIIFLSNTLNTCDLMPKCTICEKETAVLDKANVGGPIIDVCPSCLKYGKKIEITEKDKIIVNTTGLVRHVFLGSCKGD